ncbi:MAG: hypothetical protein SGCHY_000767 [Lobulomycetales sp.]
MTGKKCTAQEWQSKLDAATVNKSDLNKLIMNFLVIEGFKGAAELFAKEVCRPFANNVLKQAEISSQSQLLASIDDRMKIRNAVQDGNIDEAIERTVLLPNGAAKEIQNELDPEILDQNPRLYFHLQQQKLIEFIRSNNVNEAIEFAQDVLAPRGEENPEFLDELEKTMALLIFDSSESPLSSMLDHSQRQKTASELNAAILTSQCQEKASSNSLC